MMGWVLFFLAFMTGAICQTIAALLYLRSRHGRDRIHAFILRIDGIEFKKMLNPPDEGIEQRLYKPQGEPATVSRNAIGRRKNR